MPQEQSVIFVEVAYALPGRAIVKALHLAAPATVADALQAAAGDPDFAGIDMARAAVGVYGKPAGRGQLLEPGDRIEIYRALAADPKAARRARVKQARGR